MPTRLGPDRMFATCAGSIWTYDDFSACFQRDFLRTLFPLLASGASLLYVLTSWSVRVGFIHRTHDRTTDEAVKHARIDGSEPEGQSDLPDRARSNGDLRVEDLSISCNTDKSIGKPFVKVDHPSGAKVVAAAEVIAVAGEVSIHLTALLTRAGISDGNVPAIAELSAWTYIAALIVLRHLLAKCRLPSTPNLWNQTAVLYGLQWVLKALLFRSAIIYPRSPMLQGLIITDFAFATLLLLLTIGSRKGNRPLVLRYEDNLPPSKEPLASLFSIATFTWVDAIVWHGYKNTYELADVWNLAPRDKAVAVLANYRQLRKTTSLALHLSMYFKRELLVQGIWAILVGLLTFVPTLLLKAILEFVESPQDSSINAAWFYVILLACSSIAEGIANGQALWRGRKICIRLHAIVLGEVYAKTLKRKAAATTEKVLGEKQVSSDEGSNPDQGFIYKFLCFWRRKKQKNPRSIDESKKDSSDSTVNTGTIINLMAVDSFKLSEICAYLHFLWAESPVQLTVCILLLYRVLGYTSLVSVLIMILAMPLNYYIAQQFSRTQKRVMAATDARINTTNEVLQNIRIIKYFAWEQRFSAIVDDKRRAELRALRSRFIVWTLAAGFWFGMPLLIAFFSFMLYTIVEKKPLIPSVAFTALSLFSILRIPLDQLADMIARVQESKVSVDRIEEFLSEDETEKYEQLAVHDQDENGEPMIALKNATLSWGSKNQADSDPTSAFRLIGINVHFCVGGLNIIAGATGSGKTSLLMALLGEMTLLNGSVSLPGGRSREDLAVSQENGMTESVAYCAQQAWLVNDNIKQNILFATPYDAKRYEDVIKACALEKDLEILHDGDATLVGEKGIALSGGQKQRISLARALYCNAKHVLLDDCLSAVDSHTAKHIFEHCILGPLMFGRTCILVTHNVALCVPFSQHVVVLKKGKVATQGPPVEVMSSGMLGEEVSQPKPGSSSTTRHHSRIHSSTGIEEEDSKAMNGHVDQPNSHAQDAGKATTYVAGEDNKANIRTEGKTTGRVKIPVIKMYLAAMGPWYFWMIAFVFFVGQQISSVATTVWIRQWANSYSLRRVTYEGLFGYASATHQNLPNVHSLQSNHWTKSIYSEWRLTPISGQLNRSHEASETVPSIMISEVNATYYLAVYALLGIVYIGVSMAREGFLFYGSLAASRKLHSRLLVSVTRAKFKFFDSTPLGQLMNRFSKDLEAVDQEVAPIAVGLLGDIATIVSIVILISIITPRFLIAAIFISITYFAIAKFYLSSSTDLKRLESVQRSPLYQHFGETLSGVTTIRAYGDERRFIRDNQRRVDTQHRPFIYLWAANRWLALRVDVTGAMVSFFAGVFIILSVGKLDAGAAGLSLTYAVTFTENVLWLVRLYSANEQNMNSVERVKEYLEVDQEANAIISDSRPDGDWPQHGNIDFINYSTRYRADLKPVLKHVTFNVRGGERVGVVGRTGAGKSSLTLALFRGLEADEGKIIIDGVDIASIGLQDLREAITIVPQDPTLFTGTIRSNLDPFGLFTDEEVLAILRQVQLIDAPGSTVPLVPTTPPATTAATATAPDTPPTSEDTDDRGSDELDLSRKMTNTGENANLFTDLSTAVAESGSNLSQGQRQLLCLARALLKAPRVLVMDEATASIDYATDAKIQDTLRTVKGSTIITIAHRLQTIIDYDKVLVLDKGAVVEYDSPWALLSRENSIFHGMCKMSGDLENLLDGARIAEDKKKLIEV
ncbi:MAG: hypothetical protein Q9191_004997 [Dirinaria sp. TL-2023a]